MKEFTLPANCLKAMTNLSCKQDIRYYLQGVYVEIERGHIRLVATDGHIMGIYQLATDQETEKLSLIIPNEIIAKLDKRPNTLILNDNGTWAIDNINFTPIEGTFPDYKRVLPTGKTSGEAAQFNPEFITRFAKAGKLLLGKTIPVISHNGGSSAIVDIGLPDQFIGIMMPMRLAPEMKETPYWIKNISETV